MKTSVKILSILGTRPEAIKMAPLLLSMASHSHKFTSIVCVTGQHREMLDQVICTFRIPVHYDLQVMAGNQGLAKLTSKVVVEVEKVIDDVKPDLVFVQGDTTTTLAAALAAFYKQIPIAHIEAGLRTGDLYNPFPEEANRVLADRLAFYCFAPTEQNRKNLLHEGVPDNRIFVTGNTAIDALLMVRGWVKDINPEAWDTSWGPARKVILDRSRLLILITAHRRENFGPNMRSIFEAIRELAEHHVDWNFIYPVHLNPNVQEPCRDMLSDISNVYLIEPLEYEPFVYLMDRSYLILTDSGGIQEEAPSLGKPVLVMREKTERQEALKGGTVCLVGTDKERIKNTVEQIIQNPELYQRFRQRSNPYGDGLASQRILNVIENEFGIC